MLGVTLENNAIELDHLFRSIVLSKFTYTLPVYGASLSDLNIVQRFLTRCYKRRYTMEKLDIFYILDRYDRRLHAKIVHNSLHLLYPLIPKVKEYSKKLCTQSSARPGINREQFKNCFFNRLDFKYNEGI